MLEKNYNPKDFEERIYQKWEKEGDFIPNMKSEKDAFCIVIPPPNVTGYLHMGHALDNTLQDILIRYNRMLGKKVLWQVGTDHAGIATQMVVERSLAEEGIKRHDLAREKFIEKVWEWKAHSGGTITKQLRRLGASIDWNRERFTMDEGLSRAVRKIFVSMFKDGLIYKDKRLVNWDSKFQTAVSDLEVIQHETVGKMYYYRYQIEGTNEFIKIATTRPETMFGDTAVAVHPENEKLKHLIGKNVIIPIINKAIPIVGDEHADPEKGTGAVKITPAHDFNDFEVGKRHNLPMVNILNFDGTLNENTPYENMDTQTARVKTIETLTELGLMDEIKDNPMVIPYGDRSNVVIEPLLTDQWFVDAQKLAVEAIRVVEEGEMQFVPKNYEKTYFEWMRNIQPWCISRQLWWGHQVPVWYGPDGKSFCEENVEEAQAEAKKHYGKEVELTRDTDVLDTWFSSGLWAFSTLGWPDDEGEFLNTFYPTSVLVTGFDIIFFWVARMMMMSMYAMKKVPFKTVYMHGLVRDEKGQKMSKSKGNVVDPIVTIDEYGADALRFFMAAMETQGRDVNMAESRIQGYRNFATKLWNASRFCEMNECKVVKDFDETSVKMDINKWIVAKVKKASKEITDNLNAYRFSDSANAVYQFIWGSFCDWYIEMSKPIFYSDNEAEKAETRATAAWVLDRILVILHPFMPFITTELWENLAQRDEKLIHHAWPLNEKIDEDAMANIDWAIELITSIRSLRAEMNLPAGAKLTIYLKDANAKSLSNIKAFERIICTLARLEKIEAFTGEISQDMVQNVFKEATIILPLKGVVDFAAERERLNKELANLNKDLEVLAVKLANPRFVEKAPAQVVEEERRRQVESLESKAKVEEALKNIENL
ncbi:MAG: valine--tRNA ligase [Alphaproteobacteria bacterium]